MTTRLFSDPDVNALQSHGGVIPVGPWQLHLPTVFGFCGGVHNAIQRLQQVIERHPDGRIWLLGEIIHNSTVNAYFRELLVTILPENEIADVFNQAASRDIIVIPAFGIPRDLDNRLRQTFPAEQIIDTTCRYVKRIWTFAEARAANGDTIVIHGKANHPETRATVSRALTPKNAVIVVPTVAAARELAAAITSDSAARLTQCMIQNAENIRLHQLALVNQTTMLHAETREIEALLSAAAAAVAGELQTVDTVCRATQDRQDAALALCQDCCDLIIVIGGFASSNTNQLYRLAQACRPTYFIDCADAIVSRHEIRHYLPEKKIEVTSRNWLPAEIRDIGLLAGASCPASDIGAVIRRFRSFAEPADGLKEE